ncbi:hypothetical protein HKBW3S44_01518, partial [Candidatus Hakubella thermalkaliphila]
TSMVIETGAHRLWDDYHSQDGAKY